MVSLESTGVPVLADTGVPGEIVVRLDSPSPRLVCPTCLCVSPLKRRRKCRNSQVILFEESSFHLLVVQPHSKVSHRPRPGTPTGKTSPDIDLQLRHDRPTVGRTERVTSEVFGSLFRHTYDYTHPRNGRDRPRTSDPNQFSTGQGALVVTEVGPQSGPPGRSTGKRRRRERPEARG